MKTNTIPANIEQFVLAGLVAVSTSTGLCETTNTVVSDTFINAYQLWQGAPAANLNFGAATYLYSMGSDHYTAYCYPLLKFDLTSLADRALIGSPRLEVFLINGHPIGDGWIRPVSVHQVLIPWDASSATWNTFGSSPGVQWGNDVGPSLSLQNIVWPGSGARLISWDVPASVIQGWIDNPASNNGLLLNNQYNADHADISFAALENTSGYPAARLILDTKPHRPTATIRVSEVEICWDTISSDYWYQVQYMSALTGNQWVPLSTNWVQGSGGSLCTVAKVLPGQPQQYFQIAVTNAPPTL